MRVCLITANPDYLGLVVGDVLVVIATGTEEATGRKTLLVMRDTDGQRRIVYADDVRPVSDYRPASPDAEIDDAFSKLMLADDELATFVADAEVALGAVDPELSAVLTDADSHGTDVEIVVHHAIVVEGEDGERRVYDRKSIQEFEYEDTDGDRCRFTYLERLPEDEEEGDLKEPSYDAVFIADSGRACEFPVDELPHLIKFLQDCFRRSQR